jgi:tetratricopeptide (TPR) repeat protein
MSHLDEEALADHVLSSKGGNDDPETAAHLAVCAECTVRLNAMRAFLDTLESPVTWQAARALDAGRAGEDQLLTFAAQAQQEYLHAQAALSPLLSNAVAFVRERVDRKEEYRTLGAVRVLAEAANAACEREPIHARNLADAAVTLAGALPAGEYPADSIHALRGLAWKERANALRYLAEYDAALDALDHAAREFGSFGPRTFELANLAYIRAVILTYTDKLDEATEQAALSTVIFTEYGEVERAMRSRSVQAGVFYYRRDYRGALTIFEELMAFAESRGNSIEIARQAYNAAACLIEIGSAALAEQFLLRARDIYSTLGLYTEVARADWKLGVVPRIAGDLEGSVFRLRAAKAACESLGMADEAANASLDLMESLLLDGQAQEIVSLCSDVLRHYRRAGKLRQALTAVAFLKEAAAAGRIRTQTVIHVRKFVETLDRQPELLFVPPPD